METRCECGGAVADNETMCWGCVSEYWSMWCEECGADPEDPCADDCPNADKGVTV